MSDKKAKKPTTKTKKKSPTKQQEAFIQELPTAKNQTEAARKAGFANPERAAHKLLQKPHVVEAVEEKRQAIREKYELTEERILDELMAVAFTNANDVMNWGTGDMTFVPSSEVDEMAVRSIEAISVTYTESGGSVAMKRYDKVAALKLLGQTLGMWKDARRKPDSGSKQAAMDRIRGAIKRRQGR